MSDKSPIAMVMGFLFVLFIAFIVYLILTNITIWVVAGLFGIDWAAKFWYVFWGLIVLWSITSSARK